MIPHHSMNAMPLASGTNPNATRSMSRSKASAESHHRLLHLDREQSDERCPLPARHSQCRTRTRTGSKSENSGRPLVDVALSVGQQTLAWLHQCRDAIAARLRKATEPGAANPCVPANSPAVDAGQPTELGQNKAGLPAPMSCGGVVKWSNNLITLRPRNDIGYRPDKCCVAVFSSVPHSGRTL